MLHSTACRQLMALVSHTQEIEDADLLQLISKMRMIALHMVRHQQYISPLLQCFYVLVFMHVVK